MARYDRLPMNLNSVISPNPPSPFLTSSWWLNDWTVTGLDRSPHSSSKVLNRRGGFNLLAGNWQPICKISPVHALEYGICVCHSSPSLLSDNHIVLATIGASPEQYIILNNGILKSNSSVLPSSEGYTLQ